MPPPTDCAVGPTPIPAGLGHSDLRNLQARVSAEFREMPGLTLTIAQAARLFSIEEDCCVRVLGALVQCGVLAIRGRNFSRADAGA
jgi:hypothetical protein